MRNYGKYFYGIEMKYGLDNFKTKKDVVYKAFIDILKDAERNGLTDFVEVLKKLKMIGGTEYLTFLEKFAFGGQKWDQRTGESVASNLKQDGANELISVPRCDVEGLDSIYDGNEKVDERENPDVEDMIEIE